MKKILLLSISILLMSMGVFAQTSISFDQYGNVLLSAYDSFDDSQVVTVTLTVNNSSNTDVGAGWGIGTIKPINNSTATAGYSFICQAASATGEENVYEFTIAQFKEYAKVDGAYYTDSYGQQGITINVYNGATITSIVVADVAVAGASFDFESDAINDTYSIVAWSSTNGTATVEANPTVSTEHSLHFIATSYNTYPKFSVGLPTGKTLSDVEKITFDIYFNTTSDAATYPQNKYKGIDCFFGTSGTSFTPNAATFTVSNLIGGESNEIWLSKEIDMANLTDATLLALNTFDFAMGINHPICDYYLDNIVFVEKSSTGVENVSDNSINAFVKGNLLCLSEQVQSVSIYDLNGKLAIRTNNVSSIDISSLSKGLFITRIELNSHMITKKFVK